MPTKTTKTAKRPAEPQQPVTSLAPTRMPIAPRVGEEYGITALQWRVLVEQIFPAARTVEAVMMALEYCRARNLDIFKKPVHIVPMWSSQKNDYVETVWPGISEIRTTAHRTSQYAGMDPMVYGPEITSQFTGDIKVWENGSSKWEKFTCEVTYYEWIEVTVYRMVEHQRVPFTLRTFWEEAYATVGKTEVPNDMWRKRPKGQHMKVAEAAVLRMAFPEELGNVYAAEEMEGKAIDVTPPRPEPAAPPPRSVGEAAAKTKAAPPDPEPEEEAPEAEGEPAAEPKEIDKLEALLAKATTVEEIDAIWNDGEGFDWGLMTDDEIDVARQMRRGRIAQLNAPAQEPEDKENG